MTKEEAIFCEKSYIGETNCTDCKYYGTDTCQSRVSHKMAIKALEQSSDCKIFGHKENCIACAEEHEQLAEWLKQLKEIKRILDAPSYEENGVIYSYCYDSDTKLKHIREVIKND